MHAAPQQAAIRRDRLISLDMGEVAQELAQEKERARPGGIASRALSSGANAASEHLARCAASCHFACTCCIGALHSMAPPTLAAAEAACMLAVYLAAVPNAFPTRTARVHYTFAGSAEDVVVLSLLRCAAVTLAHCLGTGPLFQRPYRLTAFLFCSASLPLGLMKLVALVKHSQWPRRQWPPFIALFALHMAFAALQVLAAQRIVTWARKRWEHGLGGLGLPWQEGEDAWLLAGQLQSRTEEGSGAQACPGEHDLPPDALADPDSRWAHCGALRVHYKLALPLGCRGTTAGAGLVLVHSFGGGTFAWRHVMQPLADACGLPVLAFDRPGFGLTDRPVVPPGASVDSNPYSLKSQALLALDLASSLGLRNVVLGGHGDGALLAVMSAAMAAREAALGSSPPPSPAPFDGSDRGCDGRQGAMPVAAQGSVNVAGGRRRQLSGGSIPDSLDWAWMSSQPDSGPSSLLQHLLRGEWPASIEPRPGTGASVGPPLSGWASGQSPLRPPRRWGRRGAETPLPQPLPQCAEDEAGPEEGQEQLEGIIPEQEGLQQEQQVLADAELQPQLLVQQVQQASSGQVPAAVGTQRDTAAELGSDAGEMRHWPAPAGLILLHPDLSGNVAPNYARVLAHSRLGRRVLRSLLRTEVGEVTNRRAWADPHRLTPGLLALYRRPLSIEGWDLALTEVARVRNHIASLERRQLLGAVVQAGLPVLVATGESDHVSPPGAAARLAEQLGAAGPRLAVLPACGHLSHEEAPQELLDFLQSFLLEQGLGRPQL